jgi:hypothetical protein
MTDDDPENDQEPGGSGGGWSGGGGGGGGGGFQLLELLFFMFRYPKLSLVVLGIGAAVYFLGGGGGSPGGGGPVPPDPRRPAPTVPAVAQNDDRALGATLDPKVYDQALVHEPLSEANETLPARVSLLSFAPPRGDQGHQGSCVGWATSYAARSILRAREVRGDSSTLRFSPSFTFNQIAHPGCNGTFIKDALDELQQVGDLPLGEFRYTDRSCSQRPSLEEKRRASAYRIIGYTRLSVDTSNYRTNALAVKEHLAQGAPVVIGMNVGGTFMRLEGARVWHPTQADYAEVGGWGGHAMAVIGYDDTLEGGAFQLMNSWGPGWGEDGVAFVRYRDFDHFVREAYGLYPMRDPKAETVPQHIQFGLVETGSQHHIPVTKVSDMTFRTTRPIRKGTRFKVEFSNTRPCFTYLFGQDTDGSSYVLFPYTEKHSPYCGTTGTRIFPRKQSLTADNVGTRDSIAVVISPKELDFKALNAKITASAGHSYAEKLTAALGTVQSSPTTVSSRDGLVELDEEGTKSIGVHALVLEFDKN